MKVTNKLGIPDSLFRYLSQDSYDYEEKGDSLSVTEIINPVQIVVLRRRYWDKIEVEALDRLWVLLGAGVHAILEKEEGIEKIERLKVKVNGREVSGRFDRIFDNVITDYKVTSAWTVVYGSRYKEWSHQLSIYRWLYYKVKGILLNKHGSIAALLRDWSEKNLGPSKPGRENRYPKIPALEIEFALMSTQEAEDFVKEKVKSITKAEKMPDKKLPECTKEERWWNEKQQVYIRCQKHCEVAKFCKQLEREKGS